MCDARRLGARARNRPPHGCGVLRATHRTHAPSTAGFHAGDAASVPRSYLPATAIAKVPRGPHFVVLTLQYARWYLR